MTYEFVEHTADVKFRATAPTLTELFMEAAKALNETIRGDIDILERIEHQITVEAQDLEGLLYNFLEEFIFLLDAKDFLSEYIKDVEIDQENFHMSFTVIGDLAEHYKFTNDVKAITFDDLHIEQDRDGWSCQVVLDV